MLMRKLMPVVVVLTAACAPQQWTRPGATETELLSDSDQCQTDANTKAPVNLSPIGTYIWASPTTPLSNYNGTVPSGLGAAYNGNQSYVDINQDARQKLFDECMKGRGYSLTAAP
jgi:hypothetical protein